MINFDIVSIFDTRNYDEIEPELDVITNININGIDIWNWRMYMFMNRETIYDAHSVITKKITLSSNNWCSHL